MTIEIRTPNVGEGEALASLWKELWDAHEAWGGYAGSPLRETYEALALRLDDDARLRRGQPLLGRHIHIVATLNDRVVGQVEGWFEKYGIDDATPFTCEVRSLIVTKEARAHGVGAKLLDRLSAIARDLAKGSAFVLAAEVLHENPARAFYAKVGYRPVSFTQRVRTDDVLARSPAPFAARIAEPRDAFAIAVLESTLAHRRRSMGDHRFDRPRALDATLVGAIATHLGRPPEDQCELVVLDRENIVRGAASLVVSNLDPPFIPARRAALARTALDPSLDATLAMAALVEIAAKHASRRGAATIEITDLPTPTSTLYDAMRGAGAAPWSSIVLKSFR